MTGRIDINGQIGSFDGVDGVELVDIISQVKKQPDATSYRVYINSEGGRVDVGFDIYNYLRSLGLPITTIGNGLVASIATVIFMAGDKRVVREGNMFMIHLPMGGATGTAEEIETYAKAIRKIERKVIKFYSEKFGMEKEAIEPLLKNETWLTDAQLSELGITTMEAINVAAKAKITTESLKDEKMADNKKTEKSILTEIFNVLKGVVDETPQNKVVLTADLKELVFSELEKDAVISKDDKATLNGEPAKGEVVLQDGRTLRFENGKVVAIEEKPGVEDDADELEVIKTELAQMKTDKAAAEAEKARLETELAAEKKKTQTHEAILNKLKALETEVETDEDDKRDGKRQQQGGKPNRFKQAVANLKKQ